MPGVLPTWLMLGMMGRMGRDHAAEPTATSVMEAEGTSPTLRVTDQGCIEMVVERIRPAIEHLLADAWSRYSPNEASDLQPFSWPRLRAKRLATEASATAKLPNRYSGPRH